MKGFNVTQDVIKVDLRELILSWLYDGFVSNRRKDCVTFQHLSMGKISINNSIKKVGYEYNNSDDEVTNLLNNMHINGEIIKHAGILEITDSEISNRSH